MTNYEHKQTSKTISIDYNNFGQKISLKDPDVGEISYQYNRFGQITQENNPNGIRDIIYDKYGRLEQTQLISNETSPVTELVNYKYISTGQHRGKIEKIIGPNNNNYTQYHYDDLGRLHQTDEYVDNEIFTNKVTFNVDGSIKSQTFPSGVEIENTQDDFSKLNKIIRIDGGNPMTLWAANVIDNMGRITQYRIPGINVKQQYDLTYTNKINEVKFTDNSGIELTTYQYNWTNHQNLEKKIIGNITETFDYDEFDRIVSVKYGNTPANSISYDVTGGIKEQLMPNDGNSLKYTYKYDRSLLENPNSTNFAPQNAPVSITMESN